MYTILKNLHTWTSTALLQMPPDIILTVHSIYEIPSNTVFACEELWFYSKDVLIPWVENILFIT